ncbi:MAG: Hsp20/alpha crystallin family protein [Anaerolineae bacterium]
MKRREKWLIDEIEQIHHEIGRLVQETIATGRWLPMRESHLWRPPTDVYETDSYVIVKVEIAGMAEDDFNISLSNRTLTVSGFRRDPADKLAYQQMEIAYGEFRTQVYLPWPIDEDNVEAIYKDGFLQVALPKASVKHVIIP